MESSAVAGMIHCGLRETNYILFDTEIVDTQKKGAFNNKVTFWTHLKIFNCTEVCSEVLKHDKKHL